MVGTIGDRLVRSVEGGSKGSEHLVDLVLAHVPQLGGSDDIHRHRGLERRTDGAGADGYDLIKHDSADSQLEINRHFLSHR